MKKKDFMTPLGMILATVMVIWGITLAGKLIYFWDYSSVVITILGSFCALLISYPLSEIKRIPQIMAATFNEPSISHTDIINTFTDLSKKARREGLLSLEDEIEKINDEFEKKGLQMVVDGIEPETIKEILELEIDEMERRHKVGADLMKTWGGFAPAFGMLGTLIGLINMLANLSDASKIASGMATALITTFYGSFMANVFFNPMSGKLNLFTEREAEAKEMMLEGILSIQSGVNPRVVEEKLVSYLQPSERKKFLAQSSSVEGVTENV